MDFAIYIGLASLAVVIVQQILKLKIIPATFANRYPVPTNIILSVVAALIVVWQSGKMPTTFWEWVILCATISVVAAITYNQLIERWSDLRAMETGK
jgi:hypothetical protein